MKKRTARLIAFMLAFLMLASPLASAEGGGDRSFREWETDIRMSITSERELMQESGMTLADWDEAVASMKQLGLMEPISKKALLEADENARVLDEDGVVYFIGPSSLFGSVSDTLEAYRLAYRLIDLLGGSADTLLVLESKLTMNRVTVYSFQQYFDGEEVLGGTLKIALDENGEVTAVFSGINAEESREQAYVSQREAEALVATRCAEDGQTSDVLAEYTDRVSYLPADMALLLDLELDIYVIPELLVWVVYTQNEAEDADEYPYLAHYVQVNGTYLYSLPVRQPGDWEAVCGYRKQELFTGLTTDTYTGEFTDINGDTHTVTVPVMYSEADGCWYLGDVDRHIAFVDFMEAAYSENHELVMLKSEDNLDWDMEDIRFFYNYLRAYDFYADMGWMGPDGKDTDVVILSGLAYRNGVVYNNACSIGKLEAWQAFGYSPNSDYGEPLGFGWALDVLAHEYTHSFTSTVMNQNLYENDPGAINEAMSDILGNLIEYICADTDDETWMLGENSGDPIRNMSDPTLFSQPAYVWGEYYAPQVDAPLTSNDRGGVHTNSSLLNLIAAKLCLEYGMSYEEAVSFWVTTAMGLTPRTDYFQMATLLNWAMEQSGLSDRYADGLAELIKETRIAGTGYSETLPEGQKLIRLVLPDTEAFDNEEWMLYIMQYVPKTPEEMVDVFADYILRLVEDPASSRALSDQLYYLADCLDVLAQEPDEAGDAENPDDTNDAELPVDLVEEELPDGVTEAELPVDPAEEELPEEMTREDAIIALLDTLTNSAPTLLYNDVDQYITWEEMDTRVMPAVVKDRPSTYMLINISAGGSKLEKILALADDHWIDLTGFMLKLDPGSENNSVEDLIAYWRSLIMPAFTQPRPAPGAGTILIEYLPTAGLESVEFPVEEAGEAEEVLELEEVMGLMDAA